MNSTSPLKILRIAHLSTTILYYHGVSRTTFNTLISKFQLHLISKRELMKVFENKSSCYVTEYVCITSLNVAYFSKICSTHHIRTLSFVSPVSPSLLMHASGCYCWTYESKPYNKSVGSSYILGPGHSLEFRKAYKHSIWCSWPPTLLRYA
jgi:hypothetical protein